jgi:UDP-N-acetylmuramoyl-L-alanyl-D-glutamate--2,6-diaminopimelate ligase
MMAAVKIHSTDAAHDRSHASNLFAALDALPARITDVTANSREARAGFLFLAYPGGARDGRDFIADAIARGASAVAFDDANFAWKPEWRVPHLAVPQLKTQASAIAGHVYRDPSHALWMVGVTGTNGKTSVSQWVAEASKKIGRNSAVIGTIGNGPVSQLAPSDNTTPDAVALQRTLRQFADAGINTCAMEVSSHGLDQRRVDAVKFDVAIFTNLTRDHLDYHGTMEAYGEAKAMLFAAPGLKTAVINVDDAFGRDLADRVAARGIDVIRFACNGGSRHADLIGTDLSVTAGGLSFKITGRFGDAHVESAILGAFNVSNLLAVVGALLAMGVTLSDAAAVIGDLAPVPGRMQTVRVGDDNFGDTNKPLVVVDYAHTPDALEKALSTVAAIVPDKGRLISVFGCGGNRDRGKRPQMGAISAKYADLTVVTSDNPRHEDPDAIIADIEPGLQGAAYRTIADRHQAIYEALNEAGVNDIVVIAGKGHEDYQIVGDTKHHFSDVEEAREALAQWKGRGA